MSTLVGRKQATQGPGRDSTADQMPSCGGAAGTTMSWMRSFKEFNYSCSHIPICVVREQ